jgi:hypothetical protein
MLQRSRTFFMLLKATTNWRVLDHDARRGVFDAALTRALRARA